MTDPNVTIVLWPALPTPSAVTGELCSCCWTSSYFGWWLGASFPYHFDWTTSSFDHWWHQERNPDDHVGPLWGGRLSQRLCPTTRYRANCGQRWFQKPTCESWSLWFRGHRTSTMGNALWNCGWGSENKIWSLLEKLCPAYVLHLATFCSSVASSVKKFASMACHQGWLLMALHWVDVMCCWLGCLQIYWIRL